VPFVLTEKGQLIWNQTYEMQAPMVDVCEWLHMSIAEKKGNRIYIMDSEGKCGEIETLMPIQRVEVANHGNRSNSYGAGWNGVSAAL